jgi:hypothetical protein
MISKIKNYLLVLALGLSIGTPALVPALASAAPVKCNNISQNIADGANDASGANGKSTIDCNDSGIKGGSIGAGAKNIVDLFSVIVGIVAIIMIIYGGFRYITSGGDSGRVGNAKNTLIYAVIGLIIVALAQVIVHFVLNQSSQLAT